MIAFVHVVKADWCKLLCTFRWA